MGGIYINTDTNIPDGCIMLLTSGVRSVVEASTLKPIGVIKDDRFYTFQQAIDLGLIWLDKVVTHAQGEEDKDGPDAADAARPGVPEPDPPR